jgi:hypothetical protein
MTDEHSSNLSHKVNQAAVLKEFCQHPGFIIWKNELDKKMQDLKNEWLRVDASQGERIKIRAQVYNEMLDVIKSKILEGHNASISLRNNPEVSQDSLSE